MGAELGGDKLESRMEIGLSIKKVYHLMMKKPLLTSPASTWRKVNNSVATTTVLNSKFVDER